MSVLPLIRSIDNLLTVAENSAIGTASPPRVCYETTCAPIIAPL